MASYERQYTRIDIVRKILDDMILTIPIQDERRDAYVHLYGVGQACALIALKRGHDPEYAELCEIAGMMHDYTKYESGREDNDMHARTSAVKVWKLLEMTGLFTEDELSLITTGIANHSDKMRADDEFSEIIKDGDAMQHWLRNPAEKYFSEKSRNVALRKEFELYNGADDEE